MGRVFRLCFVVVLSLVVLSVPVLSSASFFPPIGCSADGFCNTSCVSDPDCGPPQCVHNAPCSDDEDCQPLGFCAVYRLCVCTG
ncbi:MAG TPA: hypothetical protein VLU25_12505 [Acidobacteriota bacterium]|nr:hypothetical protein [Acidobacteriota bacterium]